MATHDEANDGPSRGGAAPAAIPDRRDDDFGHELVTARRHFPASIPGFLMAPALWTLYFITIYSLHGAGCAAGLDERAVLGTDALHAALIALTAVTAIGIAAFGVASFLAWRRLLEVRERTGRPSSRHATFLSYGALLNAGLFLVATLWSGIPVVLLSACAG